MWVGIRYKRGRQTDRATFISSDSMTTTINILLLFTLLISTFTTTAKSEDCVYTVYVRTGSIWKGGTDSIIGLTLHDGYGETVEMRNLVAWGGLMDPGHSYFERGNLDIFSGRGPCLAAPICAINVTSDGSGPNHGWYCNYVEVTSTGPHVQCAQNLFTVEQWLSLDTPPYELNAFRSYCPRINDTSSGSPSDGDGSAATSGPSSSAA